MQQSYLAIALLAVPLLVTVTLTLVGPLRRLGRVTAIFSVSGALLVAALSAALLHGALTQSAQPISWTVPWLLSGGTPLVEVGVRVDGISCSMLAVVALVAFCVQLFSIEYLSTEPPASLGRYFTYQSLFLFSMNLLVLAPNLLQLFIGWELVGTTSYLLIGYYYRKPSAARAAVKAFWLTKFADMGLLIGLIALYTETGSLAWDSTLTPAVATVVGGLMFLAVIGKSAQFPLHVWLPDAMEGPTPVSALLHAATLVAAGVFLIVRADPLFDQAPAVRVAMLYVGAFTALFAAVVALAQNDIKRVLAYSTCSQLGYMIAALGAGSLIGGYFHLTTHAFFKALLFLGAGSVIHAVHSNDLRQMGGLWRRMRVTGAVFIIGALALAGVPGFSGFFSKDTIIEALLERELWLPGGALLVAVFLTAFYMGRVILLVFFGEPSQAAAHARESSGLITVPLVVLAVPSVAVGYFAPSLADLWGENYHFHVGGAAIVASLLALAGLVSAWLVYVRHWAPASLVSRWQVIAGWIEAGAVDRAYLALYRGVLLRLAATASWIDRYIVDGLINAFASTFLVAGERLRKIQTGYVQDYVFAVMAGAAALAVWGISR